SMVGIREEDEERKQSTESKISEADSFEEVEDNTSKTIKFYLPHASPVDSGNETEISTQSLPESKKS
ncbi:hypothetical protein PENTCL1PPCAC_24478, partial [Pristionchus entomophagus]